MDPERIRLEEDRLRHKRWRKWGPYLSERQWGTVREDYSPHGNAWEYFPHDHARSRAYRWGEDGIAGFSDREQRLCFALALWNGRDPILKERLFGLTNGEGNHGEDVKELYYYLDATPTHSYLKMLYKYPQAEYPYGRLVEENRRRGIGQPEFELVDSGLFEANRYFDVFVEYAQAEPGDVLIQVTVENRGPEAASIHLLPQLWFRNTWSWKADAARPVLTQSAPRVIRAEHPDLGVYHLHADGDPTELLFCDNESNNQRLWNQPRTAGFFKDGFNDRVVHRDTTVVNPAQCGTKAAPWYTREVPTSGQSTPRSQSRVGAFEQCRHHLDAGQMGIPLVRSLGPRLSLHSARGSRRRICQGAARAPDARVVHAPERAATRLRVGLRGRQSTGACLGHVARVPDRPQATRGPGRPGIPGARVPQADAELHLVGQPQGCGGPEPVPGWLPRARQHRGLRPQQPIADRRSYRSVGWHQLDGDVCLESHAHRAGAGPAQPA